MTNTRVVQFTITGDAEPKADKSEATDAAEAPEDTE